MKLNSATFVDKNGAQVRSLFMTKETQMPFLRVVLGEGTVGQHAIRLVINVPFTSEPLMLPEHPFTWDEGNLEVAITLVVDLQSDPITADWNFKVLVDGNPIGAASLPTVRNPKLPWNIQS